MIDLSAHKLRETNELISVNDKEDFRQLILSMSQQAQHRILIFSHHLDKNLFDTEPLYEAIKQLAIRSHRTHIHIILQDAYHITKNSHRLLALAQRISSHIKIKVTAKEHRDIFETFIIFDEYGFILHHNPERFAASGNFYDPLQARQLSEKFTEIWEQAEIDISLRRLSL